MPNKPVPVTDAEAETWHERYSDQAGRNVYASPIVLRLIADRARYREALRLWDDHLPGCSGSPRCKCGLEEAQALLEVQDGE